MKTTTETVTNVTYSDGYRVATIERKTTKSDDLAYLGNLYYRLSDLNRRLGEVTDENEIAAINADIAKTEAEIAEYEGYIAGYDTATTE